MTIRSTDVVLVTGGSGFIGRHVVRALVVRGVACRVLMRQPPKEPLPVGATLLVGDMAQATIPQSVTHCIHLAWGGLPNYTNVAHLSEELPKQQAFLEMLVHRGLRKLVVAGTCLEYGMQSGALHEALPLQPTMPYAQAKLALLHWLERLQQAQPFDMCWARLFYMYGQGQHAGALFSQLSAAIARGDKEFPMSGGAQQRDFLPVELVAEHLVDLVLMEGNQGVVNIGSGVPVSVKALVEGWLQAHGWSIELALGKYPYATYEPMDFWGDVTKLRTMLQAHKAGGGA